MIVIIDNYDSFSYNLYQLAGSINPNITVVRNDELSVDEIAALNPTHIILSPGPGRPADAGICEDAVRFFAGRTPVLGVCLGHQAICEAFGAVISHAKKIMHGKKSVINLDTSCKIFAGLEKRIEAARYHSLVALKDTLPDVLVAAAKTDDGELMAVRRRDCDVYGVQFHPESILTPDGFTMLKNFLSI